MLNQITSFIKRTLNLFLFNFKSVLRNIKLISLFLMIILISLIIPIFFVPIEYCISVVIFLGSFFSSMILFISTSNNFKNSDLIRNYKLIKTNYNLDYYVSSFMTFFLSISFSMIILFLSLNLLQENNLLMNGWIDSGDYDEAIDIMSVDLNVVIYSSFELALVLFSILIFSQKISSNNKGMYLLISVILILSVVFGGIFNNYFSRKPHNPIAGNGYYRIPTYGAMAMPDYMFYPTMIILPFFGPLQHFAFLKWSIKDYNFFVDFFIWEKISDGVLNYQRWNALWLIPYIHVFILLGTSSLMGKKK